MVRIDHLGEAAAAALAFLWDLDTRAGGYTRRGVRGWARREDVEDAIGRPVPELLPRLRDRGLVQEERVQVPGTRPVAVYRITGYGELLLSRRQGREARPPWPAGAPGEEDAAVYLPPVPRMVLELLKAATLDPRDSPYLPGGGAGWRTEEELWDQLHPRTERWVDEAQADEWLEDAPLWRPPAGVAPGAPGEFGRSDLEWLERGGLAQRWAATPEGRVRPIILWRATDTGLMAVPLEWHPPRAPQS